LRREGREDVRRREKEGRDRERSFMEVSTWIITSYIVYYTV
jgi:hypothetical protein